MTQAVGQYFIEQKGARGRKPQAPLVALARQAVASERLAGLHHIVPVAAKTLGTKVIGKAVLTQVFQDLICGFCVTLNISQSDFKAVATQGPGA